MRLHNAIPQARSPASAYMSVEVMDYGAGEISDPPQANYIVCLVTDGCGLVRSRLNAGRPAETMVTPGFFLPIVPPGCSAEFQTQSHMRHLVLTIPTPCFERTGMSDTQSQTRLDRLYASGFVDPLLAELAKRLLRENIDSADTDPLVATTLQDAFCLLLCRAADALPVTPVPDTSLTRTQTQRIIDFLEHNLAQKLTLADIARHHGMSDRAFSAAFKAATGTTLRQYLIALRIERAKRHLSARDLNLVDIADATGFADQAHFTATFARRVGISPARYRRRLS